MENLVSDLFKTKAINAGKEDKPFWYIKKAQFKCAFLFK